MSYQGALYDSEVPGRTYHVLQQVLHLQVHKVIKMWHRKINLEKQNVRGMDLGVREQIRDPHVYSKISCSSRRRLMWHWSDS